MTDRSAIEWTQATWNPVTGCDRISPGCQHCYALTLATRLKAMGQAKYQTDGDPRTSGPGFGVAVHPHALLKPLGWRQPRRIFVCSMADLFHARVPEAFIAQVFAVMATAGHHTYQVLTKRPPRMEHLLGSDAFAEQVFQHATSYGVGSLTWPLPNVWLGTSVEDQPRADQRIPKLLATPAATRFLSCEPCWARSSWRPNGWSWSCRRSLARGPCASRGWTGSSSGVRAVPATARSTPPGSGPYATRPSPPGWRSSSNNGAAGPQVPVVGCWKVEPGTSTPERTAARRVASDRADAGASLQL